MAGAMDMAAKLPKIRDEERENKVWLVDLRVFITIDSSVWICFCCLRARGDRRAHVWQRYVRAGQVMISELFQEVLSDFDLNRVGYHELVGEIIRLEGDMATIQVAFDVFFWSVIRIQS